MSSRRRIASWSRPGQTQTAGTAIYVGIPPSPGARGSSPYFYSYSSTNGPKWLSDGGGIGVAHISQAIITSGSTAHTWYCLRPKNFTTINEAVTKNDTTIVMADNPGTYSTNFKYPLPPGVSGVPGVAADNTPASGDYCCFQLDNGSWHFSLISSLSTLTLTIATGTPNVDGSTAAVGRILFFFGAGGDTDPATNETDPTLLPPVSATTIFGTAGEPILSAHRPGDPLVLVNANATAASTLAALSGYYSHY
jgi:hypothetical protein